MSIAHRAIAPATSITVVQAVMMTILTRLRDDLMKIAVISSVVVARVRAVATEEVEDIFRAVEERADEELIETKVLPRISILKTKIIRARGLRIPRPQTDCL